MIEPIKLEATIVAFEDVVYDAVVKTSYINEYGPTALILIPKDENPSNEIALTVNIPPFKVDGQIIIDVNSSVVEKLIPKLIEAKIIAEKENEIQSGYVIYPIYTLGSVFSK